MKLFINPAIEAKVLLGACAPYAKRTDDGTMVCAPANLSCLMEYKPTVQGSELNTMVDAAFAALQAPLTIIKDARDLTEQNGATRRIMKQMFANRPAFTPTSSLQASGAFGSSVEKSWLLDKNGELSNKISVNRVYLEQCLLTSAQIDVRNGGANQDEIAGKRQNGEGPIVVGIVPGAMANLAMKEQVGTLTVSKLVENGGMRTASSVPTDDVIGWGGYYTRGADAEPDDPYLSMNYESMWGSNAGIVRPYVKRGRYTGQYCMSKKAKNRDSDRDQKRGECDFDSNEIYHLLNDSLDYQSQGSARAFGVVCAGSSDVSVPPEGDTPANVANVRNAATSELLRDAVIRTLRNYAITMAIHTYDLDRKFEGADYSFADLWHSTAWDEDKLQILKAALYYLKVERPMGETVVALGGIGYGYYGDPVFTIPVGQNIGKADQSYASTGSVTVGLPVALTRWYVSPFAPMLHSTAYATTSVRCLHDFTYGIKERGIFGKSTSGSWESSAVGRMAGPSCLYSAAGMAKGLGGHLMCFDARYPQSKVVTAMGTGATLNTDLLGKACVLMAGAALDMESNGVGGFFEDGIEYDVSDWDTGDAFFVFFFSNCRR